MTASWSQVPLSTLLERSNEVTPIEPSREYSQVTVRLWGKGVALRARSLGAEIAAQRQFVVRPRQFILSRIDARNGAFGLVPSSLDGAVVSNDFPVFNIRTDFMLPEYLEWLSRTRGFIDICKAASEGTTNRVRLQEERFLATTIPLPPLTEQRRIVARIEQLAAKIDLARGLRREAVEEANILSRDVYKIGWNLSEAHSAPQQLSEVAEVIDPQPSHRVPPEVSDGLPYITIANIGTDGRVDTLRARHVPVHAVEAQEASFKLQTGDIVLGKIGTIGAARPIIVESRFALCANIVLVQPNRELIIDRLLLALLRSPQIADQFNQDTRNTAQQAFGIKKMRRLLVPVPPLPEQRRIVAYLDDLQAKEDALKRLQAQTSAELDALLPSILDKAFKGEL